MPSIGDAGRAVRADVIDEGTRYVVYRVECLRGRRLARMTAAWRWPSGSPTWLYDRVRPIVGALPREGAAPAVPPRAHTGSVTLDTSARDVTGGACRSGPHFLMLVVSLETELFERFFEVEDRHWWFAGRRTHRDRPTCCHSCPCGSRSQRDASPAFRMLDLGCGTGGVLTYLNDLAAHTASIRPMRP
ncbi:MAG: hypothetical protein U0531_20950 [Dehalococcoidia bacterium]